MGGTYRIITTPSRSYCARSSRPRVEARGASTGGGGKGAEAVAAAMVWVAAPGATDALQHSTRPRIWAAHTPVSY